MTAGHNSGNDKLIAYFERYERLDAEIATIREAMKDIITEMRGNGYDKHDVTAFKELIAERKKDQEKLAAIAESKTVMRDALDGTPLGQAMAKAA